MFAVKRGEIVGEQIETFKEIQFTSKYRLIPLCEIANISRGASPRPIDSFITSSEHGINWIKIGDISVDEKYVTTTSQKITAIGALKSRFVRDGDFIISNSMSAGRPYIVKTTGCIHDGWLLMSDISVEIDKDYFYYILSSPTIQDIMVGKALGSVVKNLNILRVSKAKIPLPPIDVQRSLAAQMDIAFQRRTAKLREADALLAGMDSVVLDRLGVELQPIKSTLAYAVKLGDIRTSELFCSPTYPDYLRLIDALKDCRWYKGELEQFVLVNPHADNSTLNDDSIVSFVPMTAVGNRDNTVDYEERRYSEVKTGYTVFQRGDLLWAKITPCMQNGKSCLVADMPTQIGFGSTEFHVLRRNSEEVYMPYIWAMLANATILKMAQAVFNGSAGQQRVSDSFLKKFPLPLPDVAIQKEIADSVFAALEKVYALKREAETEWTVAKARFERELLRDRR